MLWKPPFRKRWILWERKNHKTVTPGPIYEMIHGDFFPLVFPLKVSSTENLIYARLSVSRTIYVNVDSPKLSFPYFNFLGGYQWKKSPCIIGLMKWVRALAPFMNLVHNIPCFLDDCNLLKLKTLSWWLIWIHVPHYQLVIDDCILHYNDTATVLLWCIIDD